LIEKTPVSLDYAAREDYNLVARTSVVA
jgi:hypothetical protein